MGQHSFKMAAVKFESQHVSLCDFISYKGRVRQMKCWQIVGVFCTACHVRSLFIYFLLQRENQTQRRAMTCRYTPSRCLRLCNPSHIVTTLDEHRGPWGVKAPRNLVSFAFCTR